MSVKKWDFDLLAHQIKAQSTSNEYNAKVEPFWCSSVVIKMEGKCGFYNMLLRSAFF